MQEILFHIQMLTYFDDLFPALVDLLGLDHCGPALLLDDVPLVSPLAGLVQTTRVGVVFIV